MFKKNSFKILALNSIFILILVGNLIFFKTDTSVVVFVDSVKLFNEFKMSKEVSKKGDERLKMYKAELDSLYYQIDLTNEDSNKKLILKEIIYVKEQMESFEINYNKDNSNKIWKRISDYSKFFSEQNNYKIILGSQFNGDIIYGQEGVDVTNDLLAFLNKKYEGVN